MVRVEEMEKVRVIVMDWTGWVGKGKRRKFSKNVREDNFMGYKETGSSSS